jgi:peptidoglycan-N-acetylglucosamine deacetylase
MTGEKAKKYPDIAAEVFKRGHTVGNHSMTHVRMLFMGMKELELEIDSAQKAISDAIGNEPVFFRPPYGVFSLKCAGAVKKRKLKMALWTVLSGDYSDISADKIFANIEPFISPGAIQVFHDTIKGGGMALPGIIRKIGEISTEKGIRLGGIEELDSIKFMETGKPNDSEHP